VPPGSAKQAMFTYEQCCLCRQCRHKQHDENAKAFKNALVGRGKRKIQANESVMSKYLTGYGQFISPVKYLTQVNFLALNTKNLDL